MKDLDRSTNLELYWHLKKMTHAVSRLSEAVNIRQQYAVL